MVLYSCTLYLTSYSTFSFFSFAHFLHVSIFRTWAAAGAEIVIFVGFAGTQIVVSLPRRIVSIGYRHAHFRLVSRIGIVVHIPIAIGLYNAALAAAVHIFLVEIILVVEAVVHIFLG